MASVAQMKREGGSPRGDQSLQVHGVARKARMKALLAVGTAVSLLGVLAGSAASVAGAVQVEAVTVATPHSTASTASTASSLAPYFPIAPTRLLTRSNLEAL
ncbi:MAG: hypothetical protein ACYDGY_05295 [Acidimicrobiales bacterium]